MKNKRRLISIIAGILAAVMLLGLIASALPSVNAASSSEIQNQLDKLKEDKKELDAQIKELESQQSANLAQMSDIVNQKTVVEQQISLMYEQVSNMNDQIASYSLMIADKQEDLDAAQTRLEYLTEKNKERVRSMITDGGISYWSVLFEADGFFDFLNQWYIVQEIADADNRRLEEMRQAAEVVEQTKNSLVAEQAQLRTSREELEATEAGLQAKIQEANELLIALQAKGQEYEDWLWEMELKEKEMLEQIADKKGEYDAAVEKESYEAWLATSVVTTAPTTAPTTAAPSGGGTGGVPSKDELTGITWLVPCSYVKLTSPFGMRMHPIRHQWLMHYGVDLAGRSDTPILATRGGVVKEVGYDPVSAGNYVIIDHLDGFESVYMHMVRWPDVAQGQYVAQGQQIGGMGTTGGSTGVHLHFGISYNGVYVNPMDYI